MAPGADESSSEPATSSDAVKSSRRSAWIQWFFLAFLGTAILTVVAVHAPARIKLIGLFSIAFGMVVGFGLGILARSLGLTRNTASVMTIVGVIAAGLVGMTVESHRLWSAKEWDAFQKSPAGQMAMRTARSEQAPDDLKASVQESIDRQRESLQFRSYLTRRISTTGNWKEPWPLIFWLAEIALASTAGSWAFCRILTTKAQRHQEDDAKALDSPGNAT
jgi:hypothetical protein